MLQYPLGWNKFKQASKGIGVYSLLLHEVNVLVVVEDLVLLDFLFGVLVLLGF